MHRFVSILLGCLLLAVCGGKNHNPDRSSEEAGPSRENHGPLAELAGSWSGSATIAGYGTAVATATLDTEGRGHYFVTLAGNHHQGVFRVLSWDRSYLSVQAEGQTQRVHATHKGDRLWIDTALIGQVLLQRDSVAPH